MKAHVSSSLRKLRCQHLINSLGGRRGVAHADDGQSNVVAQELNSDVTEAFDQLIKLAKSGGTEERFAVECIYQQAVGFARYLNQQHPGFSAEVMEWPLVIPRELEARTEIFRHAKSLNIGGVSYGKRGQPLKVSYSSQSGFAIVTMIRLDVARKLVKMLGAAAGNDQLKDFAAFTEIWQCDQFLWNEINSLNEKEFGAATKEDWIRVGKALFIVGEGQLRNQHLLPDGPIRQEVTGRASGMPSALEKKLVDGLKGIDSLPAHGFKLVPGWTA